MLATLLTSLFAAQAGPENPIHASFLERCAADTPQFFSVEGMTGATTGLLATTSCSTQELESGQTLVTLQAKDKIEVLFFLEDVQALSVQAAGKSFYVQVRLD